MTSTYGDSGVEFYNLADHTGFEETLPNCTSPACSGFYVEFDPVNKLFLVAQPISSQVNNQSTIYVYDTQGNLIETLNGLNFCTKDSTRFPCTWFSIPAIAADLSISPILKGPAPFNPSPTRPLSKRICGRWTGRGGCEDGNRIARAATRS